jgi:beta-lactamase superfamily II metal-dependent hydrolase
MTGDAREDYIVDGLERARLVRNGRADVDILKLQHHGSARNADETFFRTLLADHYVISANGTYGNRTRRPSTRSSRRALRPATASG